MEKIHHHDRVVKKWYDSLEEGKILAARCCKCGAVEFPPLYACNTCGAHDMEWIEISGDATMTSFVINGPMEPDYGEPYSLAYVQLEEGTTLSAIVFGVYRRNQTKINEMLPCPVKAEIWQRDGYKTVAFRVVK
ncbi:MAG: hypothetical protein HUJ76_12725 [Parasporobacterium sp.]|nr:hypothetical protein [Parasporobacterium sp.]